ncbi:MAG TPA: sugar ABC transporter permease [Acetobacteraceae bacterium]|jgi:multiple sugar transport system permease protein|nr:sugar ABC transporter permease [Acetobacteraceae bacterium]
MLHAQRARFAYYLILPALLLITCLNLVPIVEAIVVSLQSQNMIRPDPEAFVGVQHYIQALAPDGDFRSSLALTLIWTAGSVAGGYLLGLGLALLLNLAMRARGVFRALLLIPWVIPDVAVAMVWKWLYADQFGVFNFLLLKFGLVSRPVQWLADPWMAMASVIFVQIWKLYPVMFIVLLAALQNVAKELHEAAMIDGANAWQRFVNVTFPVIRPTSLVITLLASIWTFQAFDIVYLLTGGGPAGATQILPTLIYQKAFWASQIGYASALGILLMVCLLVISVFYLLAYRHQASAQGAT